MRDIYSKEVTLKDGSFTSVVIGNGEIGSALFDILRPYYPTWVIDIELERPSGIPDSVGCIHICFPYYDQFVSEVRRYQAMFAPKYVVIHSTVPPGTCDSLRAVHSPVRGKHWEMYGSILRYVKFFGGWSYGADEIARRFHRVGVPTCVVAEARSTEIGKILETTFLGVLVRWVQSVRQLAEDNGLSHLEVWDKWVETYNDACDEFHQDPWPRLSAIMKPIGGHCVVPNLKMLPTFPWCDIVDKGVE